jgi:hypothetical protein
MARAATSIHPKVAGATLGGAVSVVVIFILDQFVGIKLSPEVSAAITTIVTFLVGYSVPSAS